MRLYLVRHGQTAWNAERRYQGHTDIALDDRGLDQARRFADSFREPVARIVCSDLIRAQMTAEPLAQRANLPIDIRPDLRERCIGDWEALPLDTVAENFRRQELLTGLPREEIRPPNGESLTDIWDKFEPVAQEIAEFNESQVVIIHGGSGAILLSKLLGANVNTARAFRFENTGVTTIGRRPDGGFQLLKFNDSSHLAC